MLARMSSTFDMPIYKLPVAMLTPRITTQINNVLQVTWPAKSYATQHAAYEWVVMAQHQGQIIGVLFTRKESAWTYIEKLAVLPQYRRRGVAKSLLDFVHDEIDHQNAHVLHVDAGVDHNRLLDYYARHNFEIVYSNNTETMMRRDPANTQ